MNFNSIQYFTFFLVVISIYFLLSHKYRWILLLCASYYFYMCWRVEYILLILGSTVVDYFAAIQMGKTTSASKRKIYLFLSLFINIGLLFSFKYFNFFNDSLRGVFNHYNIFYGVPAFNVMLPVGISFYTFQTLSYSIDVYKGEKEPEKHFGIFALYVAFFPQLVAGPIERSTRLLPQFLEKFSFDFVRVVDGCKRILWGLFKKVVIADRLAILVNHVYNSADDFTGIPLIIATYFFTFQIYCDFSGYSDIAIGTSQVMGFKLMENFKSPYLSSSVSEFWKRWHISLSSWFRDYLYIPLGGNRKGKWRWYYNLFIVFIVSGLWHGANWTFIIWGALHGIYLLFTIWTKNIRSKTFSLIGLKENSLALKFLSVFITFNLVAFAWIFFRANSVSDAFFICTNLFTGLNLNTSFNLGTGHVSLLLSALSILFLIFTDTTQLFSKSSIPFKSRRMMYQFVFYNMVIFGILLFGIKVGPKFIYFQF